MPHSITMTRANPVASWISPVAPFDFFGSEDQLLGLAATETEASFARHHCFV